MKKMHLFLIFSLSLTIAFVLLKDQWTATQSQAISNQKRVSITFILGNDEKSTNSFYAHASYFYNMNDDHKTDYVVHSCKTLNDVLNYLKNQHNGFCYSTINLVAHGNPWQGLRLPIDKDLPRASAVHLKNALDSGMLKPLCTTKIDGGTTINVVSCAVGNNALFVEMLEQLFFCPESNSHPTIHCEKFYVNFSNNTPGLRCISLSQSTISTILSCLFQGLKTNIPPPTSTGKPPTATLAAGMPACHTATILKCSWIGRCLWIRIPKNPNSIPMQTSWNG